MLLVQAPVTKASPATPFNEWHDHLMEQASEVMEPISKLLAPLMDKASEVMGPISEHLALLMDKASEVMGPISKRLNPKYLQHFKDSMFR
jgi:hypothetical protein